MTSVTVSAALGGLPLLRVTDSVGLGALVTVLVLGAVLGAVVVVVDLGRPLLRFATSDAGCESEVGRAVLLAALGLLSL